MRSTSCRQAGDVVGLHVRLEHRHDRRADRGRRSEVVVDEIDVRIDDRQRAVRGAAEQIARTGAGVVQKRVAAASVSPLSSWSRPGGPPGATPESRRPAGARSALGSRRANGVVGVDAVGAAAVGDDLAPPRKLPRATRASSGAETGAGDVPGAELRLRAHIEHDHVAPLEPLLRARRPRAAPPVALAQVLVGEHATSATCRDRDVAYRRPQIRDPVARQAGRGPASPRGGCERARPAKTCRCCEVLATLCEISPAMSSTERSPCASTSTISARRPLPSACATDAKRVEQRRLRRPLAMIIKLSLEYLKIKSCGLHRRGLVNSGCANGRHRADGPR